MSAVLENLTSAEESLHYVLLVTQESTSTSSSVSMIALTTSFGIQSALILHKLTLTQSQTKNNKKVPIIWIDTGQLPLETCHVAKDLKEFYDLYLRT